MEGVLTDAEVLAHVRPMIFVVDDDGTIIQAAGASVSMMGFSVDDLVGRSALEFVAPRHLEAITFVFAGPGDHVVRDRHAPFPLEVLDRQGRAISCDCAAERVRRDGRVIWIATITPHPFQSASDHALDAYGRGASPLDVASTIAERLAWKWDSASELRTFMLTEPVGGRFTSVSQPGHTGPDDPILTAIAVCLESRTSWSHDHDAAHVVVAVDDLPPRVADTARRAGFEVACIAVGRLHGRPRIGLISFGVHDHAFAGNIDIVMEESMRILDMALERHHDQERLRRAAEQDSLTGLSNRLTFARALNSSTLESAAVLYIDLDHFKRVNDSYGHAVGDAVLVEVGRRIRAECRPFDVVARLGGDEFAVLLPDVGPTAAERIAHRVLARISDPLPRDLGPDRIAASGGLALAVTNDDSVERADHAMLASKRAGRAQLVIA